MDQYFSPDSKARVDITPGFFKKIAINHEVVKLLAETGKCSESYLVWDRRSKSFDICLQVN